MSKHLSQQINDGSLILIAILRQKEFFRRNNLVFDGKSCFSWYSSRISEKKINILKEICGLNTALAQEEQETLDNLKLSAIMDT